MTYKTHVFFSYVYFSCCYNKNPICIFFLFIYTYIYIIFACSCHMSKATQLHLIWVGWGASWMLSLVVRPGD